MRRFVNHYFLILFFFAPSLLVTISLLFSSYVFGARIERKLPNILIIIGDDATYNDLPLYGGVNVQTPNIDRLGSQGMVFNNAYMAMSICVPCRTELYTGLYPVHSGVCWNHSRARIGTKSIVNYLGKLGYRVGIAGKIDIYPESIFPFEKVEGLQRSCVAPTADYNDAGIRSFINRDKNQPFCLIVGLVVPHVPWTVGDPSHFNPDQLELPPNLADTPKTREDFAKYLAEIEVLDKQVGKTLKALEESGGTGNTIVIFTSEQGAQFPGCKWTNWNTGVHTAFIVRWPGKTNQGSRVDALIQYADVLPTLMDAIGGHYRKSDFDGYSFLPVLLGKTNHAREYAYFMHNNIPEGPPYPIRSITDGRYHYIRNLNPETLYIEKHMMGRTMEWKYWPSWMFYSSEDKHTRMLVNRFMLRPAEELYRMDKDPYEMINLVNDSGYARIKERLSKELDKWMQQQGDPGVSLDTWEQLKSAQKLEK